MREYKLEVSGLCKSFGETEVLRDISFQISEGELVTVLGPSGCGKSTMMNILTGIETSDAGTIRVSGKVGYMQQKDLLLPWKTCMENVILPDLISGTDREKAKERALPFFRIFQLEGYEERYPQEISGGMRQRVNFLRTFLSSGDILLLDEPFGAVDSITRGALQQWLTEVSRELKLTILLITHDIEEAILLSDRILVLSGKPAAILDEIPVEMSGDNKADRLFEPELLKLKKRILEDLKHGDQYPTG